MKEYEVMMVHKMRSVQTVIAENEEEAKALAYTQSFEVDEDCHWEEEDTKFDKITELREIEEEDD